MSENNPWNRTSSKLVYQNDWIKVREDQVTTPNGKPGIYGVVETRIATGTLAITTDNELYLVGQYRYPTNCYSWEIIEGGAEINESPLEAAKRELKEEAGLTAKKWTSLGSEVHLSNCHSSERAFFFLAENLNVGTASPDETEVLKLKKVRIEELRQMLRSGEIVDAMTIIGYYRLAEYLSGKI